MSPAALKRAQRWKMIATFAALIALVILMFSLRRQIFDTFKNFGEVNTYALLLIIPFQALNYHAYAKFYQNMFTILGKHIPYKSIVRIALELNFVNNIFPSGGVSGFSYFGLRMKSHHVPTATATLVQMMRFAMVFASFQLLLFLGLFILALEDKANGLMILIASSLTTLVMILTVGAAFIIGSKRRINSFFTFITKILNRIIQIVRPRHPETINVTRAQEIFTELHENYMEIRRNLHLLLRPFMYSLLANFSEVLCIYATYVAFGRFVNLGAVIIAYAIANFAGLLSFLPGGVGIYEGLTTATLVAAGVPAALSLPVTIMYRVISMLVQLPIGYFFYYRNLNFRKTPVS